MTEFKIGDKVRHKTTGRETEVLDVRGSEGGPWTVQIADTQGVPLWRRPGGWVLISTEEPRTVFPGGGVRDGRAAEKPRFDLLFPKLQPYELQLMTRWAEWMRLGAQKYADRNWEEFQSPEALAHAEASLGRHYAAFAAGRTDEDHAAAIVFNVMCIEYVKQRLAGKF